MRPSPRPLALLLAILLSSTLLHAETVRLPRSPQVSPDGEHIAFAWRGDLWIVGSKGGEAERLTMHPGEDSTPYWSPDGEHIAFTSSRGSGTQVYVVRVDGGAPRQVTTDSHQKTLRGFTADGKSLLVSHSTDRGWGRNESTRLFRIALDGDEPKRMVFDLGFAEAALSPDGTKVLFTRGRGSWTRKGYRGAQASQLWLADLSTTPPTVTRLDEDRTDFQNVSCIFPRWIADGASYAYVSDPDGTFDVYHRTLDSETAKRITQVSALDRSDDGVAFPSFSADGKTLVFRRRFDLHRVELPDGEPQPIEITAAGDRMASRIERVTEDSTSDIAFTADGKQMAFVAAGDVFVMDRILREPVRVTRNDHREANLVFSADGKRLFMTSDHAGEVDIWEVTHDREDGIWWLADDFTLRQVTEDEAVETNLDLDPTGKHIAFNKGTDVFVMDADGSDHRRVVEAWSRPSFDWSPDGRWLVYTTQDSDYNPDVYIVPLDGTREPFNLSRHPDRDGYARWSPDGTRIAFVSRRDGDEADIYYVNLTRQEEEKTERDKKLEEALEAMKGKDKKKRPSPKPPEKPEGDDAKKEGDGKDEKEGEDKKEDGKDEAKEKEDDSKKVEIDFEGIHDRRHRISIRDSYESGLIWSPDGKKLAFTATVDGERGFYTVEFPRPEKPKKLASSGLGAAEWLAESKEIVGVTSSGTPAAMDAKGKVESFGFRVRQTRDWGAIRQIAFDQGWRAMRDRFYDPAMNNRDWNAIRKKYRTVAAACLGADEFTHLMNMMLGELNASHMGHRGGSEPMPELDDGDSWAPTTYHLGLRFDRADEGPGLRVESVIPGSPCHEERSRVSAGEFVLAIDGQKVGPDTDLDRLLTLDELRDLELEVADGEGNKRTVTVRPVSSVSGLLYDEWVEANRAKVDELSDGKLGYLHIRGMNFTSFRQMEEDLYHAGHGKEGLIVDVRFNGGGSTTDHVLTALTQPVHAITKSRGSGEGYPQDRKIYASWSKPIVLMCNEHSFSNAEILSHSIQQLGRGRLVGMRTAGGVISTGGARLLDGSSVRMPTRGWYLITTGEDMELNGCLPDIALWNEPGGPDVQLATAVEALEEDVAAEKAKPRVKIESAAQKRRRADDDR